ncbi:LIRB1 protein, partial [Alectura lathami]|nr:LIRB1 protein [Alectura lathami]
VAPMAVALVLGWWLVALSRAQHLPPPSLSLHPSQGVALGDNITLRCHHVPPLATLVRLCCNEHWGENFKEKKMDKEKDKDMVEFSLAITGWEQAGTYQCQYEVSEPRGTWLQSDPMELVVTG